MRRDWLFNLLRPHTGAFLAWVAVLTVWLAFALALVGVAVLGLLSRF